MVVSEVSRCGAGPPTVLGGALDAGGSWRKAAENAGMIERIWALSIQYPAELSVGGVRTRQTMA